MSAYQVALARWSGVDDVCVGTPVSNRERQQLESVVGMFTNLLPIRATIRPQASFEQLLDEQRDRFAGALDFQDMPHRELIQALELGSDRRHRHFFESTLALQNVEARGAHRHGHRCDGDAPPSRPSPSNWRAKPR